MAKFILIMISSGILASLTTIGVIVVMFFYVRNNFLTHEPSLKYLNIGIVFGLPLFQLCVIAASFFFLLAFLPDRTSFIDMLSSDMAKMGLSDDQWNMFYTSRNVYGIGTVVFLITSGYLIRAMYRRGECRADNIKKIASILNIIAAIGLVSELYGFFVSFLAGIYVGVDGYVDMERLEKASMVILLITIVVVLVLFFYLQKHYNLTIDTVYAKGQKNHIPLPIFENQHATGTNANSTSPHNSRISGNSTGYSQKSTPASESNQIQSKTDQLFKLKELLDSGILTQEEFDNEKKEILNS